MHFKGLLPLSYCVFFDFKVNLTVSGTAFDKNHSKQACEGLFQTFAFTLVLHCCTLSIEFDVGSKVIWVNNITMTRIFYYFFNEFARIANIWNETKQKNRQTSFVSTLFFVSLFSSKQIV